MGAEVVTGILDTTLAIIFTWLGWKTGKILWKYTPYSYPNARINAMEAKLLSEQRFNELAESRNLGDFVVSLEDTYYKDYLPPSPSDFHEVEIGLERSLEGTYILLESILPSRVSGFFSILREEWDVRNLTSAIKAHFRGESAVSYIIPVGPRKDLMKAVAEAKSREEILALLEVTQYADAYQRLLLEEIDLREFETRVYSTFFSRLIEFAKKRKDEERIILTEYVTMWIDSINLLTIARGKLEGIDGKVLGSLLLPGGSLRYESLLSAEGIDMVLSELESTRYQDAVRRARREGSVDLVALERALREHMIARMEELSRFYPLSVATPLRYVLKRGREVRKLRAVAKLIADGVPPEKIKKMVGDVL